MTSTIFKVEIDNIDELFESFLEEPI